MLGQEKTRTVKVNVENFRTTVKVNLSQISVTAYTTLYASPPLN